MPPHQEQLSLAETEGLKNKYKWERIQVGSAENIARGMHIATQEEVRGIILFEESIQRDMRQRLAKQGEDYQERPTPELPGKGEVC